MSNFAIVVISYDGYSDLWDSFFFCLNEYWPENTKYKKYLITNHKEPRYNEINVIKTGDEISWSNKVFKALSQVEEENIMVFLEDYFIGEPVDSIKINKMIEHFVLSDYRYLRLVTTPKTKGKNDINLINPKLRYGVNLQLSLWKTEQLKDMVSDNNFSAWEFEKKYNDKTFENLDGEFYATKRSAINIQNGVIKGKWYPRTIKHFNKTGLTINKDSEREIMSKKSTLAYNIKSYLSKITPNWLIKIIKPILKKLGFKFTT